MTGGSTRSSTRQIAVNGCPSERLQREQGGSQRRLEIDGRWVTNGWRTAARGSRDARVRGRLAARRTRQAACERVLELTTRPHGGERLYGRFREPTVGPSPGVRCSAGALVEHWSSGGAASNNAAAQRWTAPGLRAGLLCCTFANGDAAVGRRSLHGRSGRSQNTAAHSVGQRNGKLPPAPLRLARAGVGESGERRADHPATANLTHAERGARKEKTNGPLCTSCDDGSKKAATPGVAGVRPSGTGLVVSRSPRPVLVIRRTRSLWLCCITLAPALTCSEAPGARRQRDQGSDAVGRLLRHAGSVGGGAASECMAYFTTVRMSTDVYRGMPGQGYLGRAPALSWQQKGLALFASVCLCRPPDMIPSYGSCEGQRWAPRTCSARVLIAIISDPLPRHSPRNAAGRGAAHCWRQAT
ncbi:hypothetical protein K458DRAFT_386668 [Lentithecium fluviatile CBS 122367]|uniref:Uncharacterized protein n=1 Tax=Lentithecium fluviatile CBS 122367 TaxID=1168545 RepID=A0A6G1J868_9PLEO|nr:hypothetical protein K458DRAFT_386668 [Lentithecium fluviatile CBS 122367]